MPNRDDEERRPPDGPSPGSEGKAAPRGADSAETTELNRPEAGGGSLAQRFELVRELGRGGMGIVHKARDRETGEVVALKVLKPEIAARADLIERFKSELRLARKITHKNVCRVYDLHRFGETVAIAMEYVEGESLRAVLNRPGGVSLRGSLNWAGEISSALAEAHAQGVVHRDLKPENILIEKQGAAKVMDFGIARSLEGDATQSGGIIGTPAYMSPEQADGKPADARSDIYSLGLILYEMFTGRAAFTAETPVALAVKQIHETPPPPRQAEPDLPARIDRAIERCLEKNPKKRFQTVAELRAALTERGEARPAAVAGKEAELPVVLTRWQPSDWLLVLAAVGGLALFFPFFNRTSLAPRSQVTFDRGALGQICEQYAQRLGAPVTGKPSMQLWWFGGQHDYVARHSGEPTALDLTNNPVPYWVWVMTWPDGTEVAVDHRGALVSSYRDFPTTPVLQLEPADAARQLAEKDLREFFGRDPSLLTLETTSNFMWSGQPAVSFDWRDPRDYHGLKNSYTVRVIGNQTAWLAQGFGYPGPEADPGNEEGWQLLPAIVLGLGVLILGISQRRQVVFGARWHIALVGLVFYMGLIIGLIITPAGGIAHLFGAVLAGVAFAVTGFFFIIGLERAVLRVWPNKLSSLVRVFDRRAISEPCGLAILRGTFIGLALLGLDFFLVWLGTSYLGMRLDSFVLAGQPPRSAMIGTGWSVTFVTITEIYQAWLVALPLSLLASFLARLIRQRLLALFATAVLAAAGFQWLLFNMGAVQPYPGKFAILLVECLLLTFAFSRFDVLTVLWAAFTFAFCWANYYLLVMFEPTGAFEEWAAFTLFGLFVLAAGVVAFKTPLARAYRRVGASLE